MRIVKTTVEDDRVAVTLENGVTVDLSFNEDYVRMGALATSFSWNLRIKLKSVSPQRNDGHGIHSEHAE
jgi:hypothetical protein